MIDIEQLRSALGDGYRVDESLGAGGMAVVYRAFDRRHARDVAIKVLTPDVAASVSHDRFVREIHIAAQLQHPLIVPVFDSGESHGVLFYVMPLVEGESLRQRLDREPRLTISEILSITRDVASAIDYAHGRGVVHRDIKPANILLSGGHALVADFGIARAVDVSDATALTGTGVMVGTPHYASPEQLLGDPSLGSRTDVYSLATVVYEMMAGAPPFPGASLQAIVAGHLGTTPAPLALDGRSVPAVDRVLRQGLAKVAAERFGTAGALADALAAAVETGRAGSPRRRHLVIGGVVVAALGLGALAARWAFRPVGAIDPDLVAVAPFDVVGTGLEVWREGFMDLLSQNLDGIGTLRVVAPSIVVKRWSGRADVASATAIGRQTGAGVSVVGSVFHAGRDSVRVGAVVVDAGRGMRIGDVSFRFPADRVDIAVDSLAVQVLTVLGRTRPTGTARAAGLLSRSFGALRAFLQGEQHFRRAEWDRAAEAFDEAVDRDSLFALAWYRIFQTRLHMGTGIDSLLWSYALRAGRLNRGLGPRDSLMIAADSVLASVIEVTTMDPSAEQRRRRVFEILDMANRRFPGDAELWYQTGRSRSRIGYLVGLRPEQALEALDRAIASDSLFAPAYLEAMYIATAARGLDATRRYAEAYLRLKAVGVNADAVRLALALMEPGRAQSAAIQAVLDTSSARQLYHAVGLFDYADDTAETSIRLARALVRRSYDPSLSPDPLLPRVVLGFALAFRGHVDEAMSVLGSNRLYLASQVAALGAMEPGAATALFDSVLNASRVPSADIVFAFPWWLRAGDTISLARSLSALQRAPGSVPIQFTLAAGRAYLLLARGDSAAALAAFSQLPTSVNHEGLGDWERYVTIRLLNDARRFREARARLEREVPSTPFPWDVVLLVERARTLEGLGDRDGAVRAYRRVATLWMHADSALQSVTRSANEAARRLERR